MHQGDTMLEDDTATSDRIWRVSQLLQGTRACRALVKLAMEPCTMHLREDVVFRSSTCSKIANVVHLKTQTDHHRVIRPYLNLSELLPETVR
jgi:hypothetical protein